MKKKTLMILLIIALVGMLLVFADTLYDLRNQIVMIQHIKEVLYTDEVEIKKLVSDRIPYLIQTIFSLAICLGTLVLLFFITIGLGKSKNLSLFRDESQKKRIQEKNQKDDE